jgi:predicted GIY-YIG superfamily endonuclease
MRIFRKHEVPAYHKPGNTLRNLLVHPKDKTPMEDQCGTIYHYKCEQCNKTYIGESARPLKKRIKEHQDVNHNITGIGEHIVNMSHSFNKKHMSVIVKEEDTVKRKVKEALLIRRKRPELNRDLGIELPPIYDSMLSRDRLWSRDGEK